MFHPLLTGWLLTSRLFTDVIQVAHHFLKNGIAHFTRHINTCISLACGNGEVAPFVGHNAFLRWSTLQDAAFIDLADNVKKIWSESNVSEDFDMALRLQLKILRRCVQSWFKEGVSLTIDDELNRSTLMVRASLSYFSCGIFFDFIFQVATSLSSIHSKTGGIMDPSPSSFVFYCGPMCLCTTRSAWCPTCSPVTVLLPRQFFLCSIISCLGCHLVVIDKADVPLFWSNWWAHIRWNDRR